MYGTDANLRQLKLLLAKRADVIGFGNLPFHYLIQQHQFPKEKFKIIHKLGVFRNIIAINPDLPHASKLSRNISQIYKKMRRNGRLEQILSHYGIPLWDEALEHLP